MKYINYIFLILFLVGCFSTKKLIKNGSYPTRFVFKKSMVSTRSGISNFESKTDSLIDATYSPNGKDSLMNKKLKEMKIADFLTQTPEIQIYVEVKNDSIWRYTKQKDKMIGDYFMIQKNSGILNYYDKAKSMNYKRYDLFSQKDEYEILENRKDRKEIKGFDCFKLTLIKKDAESDLGNTVYEMYVTDRIDLPVHSVVNLTNLVPKAFPMEIRISEEKLPGLVELYQLISIE